MPESHSKTTAPDNRELLAVATAWARAYCRYCPLESISLKLKGFPQPIRLVVPPFRSYVLSNFQKGILRLLDGKAMKVEALGEAVGGSGRLYRGTHNLKELEELGLVQHLDNLGYFRPDAPPDELLS